MDQVYGIGMDGFRPSAIGPKIPGLRRTACLHPHCNASVGDLGWWTPFQAQPRLEALLNDRLCDAIACIRMLYVTFHNFHFLNIIFILFYFNTSFINIHTYSSPRYIVPHYISSHILSLFSPSFWQKLLILRARQCHSMMLYRKMFFTCTALLWDKIQTMQQCGTTNVGTN